MWNLAVPLRFGFCLFCCFSHQLGTMLCWNKTNIFTQFQHVLKQKTKPKQKWGFSIRFYWYLTEVAVRAKRGKMACATWMYYEDKLWQSATIWKEKAVLADERGKPSEIYHLPCGVEHRTPPPQNAAGPAQNCCMWFSQIPTLTPYHPTTSTSPPLTTPSPRSASVYSPFYSCGEKRKTFHTSQERGA